MHTCSVATLVLIGPFAVAAVAVGIAALHDPMLAVWTTVFLAVLRVVEDYVIYPRLIGLNSVTRLGESDDANVRSASLATS